MTPTEKCLVVKRLVEAQIKANEGMNDVVFGPGHQITLSVEPREGSQAYVCLEIVADVDSMLATVRTETEE